MRSNTSVNHTRGSTPFSLAVATRLATLAQRRAPPSQPTPRAFLRPTTTGQMPHKPPDTAGEFAGAEPLREICSHHGTRLDKNRIWVLSCSTIIHNKTRSCRLAVISPAVSLPFLGDVN